MTSQLPIVRSLKVALVRDWLVSRGGGERVLYDFHMIFPDAPIYTLAYDEDKAPEWCKECDIRTTYIQGYYLVVSRFVRYKRVDLAIEACNKLGRRLVVVCSGGETGVFFQKQTAECLAKAIQDFEITGVSSSRQEISEYAETFSPESFRAKTLTHLEGELA